MKATILVVDDETDNLEIVTDYLTQADSEYKILQAKNGAMALKIAEKVMPDLVLTDWNMPVMDGLELTKALKNNELLAHIPVVMQTANTEDRQLKQAFESGVMDYIKKPISALELKARVHSALALSQAQKQTEQLLLNILPKEVADDLKKTGKTQVKRYDLVSVLFTDFKNFTQLSEAIDPEKVVEELNLCFLAFDEICERHNLEKIKTIGDAYMCAGGLPIANESNPYDTVQAALDMQAWMVKMQAEKQAKGEAAWQLCIGIHSGPVVAGVVGKNKFAYDIWGDTVNLASRMESSGEADKVNISGVTYELVKDKFQCTYRGKIEAKNKGEVEMYFVNG
jgi:class 3 adenylate cyclase